MALESGTSHFDWILVILQVAQNEDGHEVLLPSRVAPDVPRHAYHRFGVRLQARLPPHLTRRAGEESLAVFEPATGCIVFTYSVSSCKKRDVDQRRQLWDTHFGPGFPGA